MPNVTDPPYQAKDKFLSAVSSDGFGFCSVVLSAFVVQFVYLPHSRTKQRMGHPRLGLLTRVAHFQPRQRLPGRASQDRPLHVPPDTLGEQRTLLFGVVLGPRFAGAVAGVPKRHPEEGSGQGGGEGVGLCCRR